MKCPYCRTLQSKVVDSRVVEEGIAIRRRRECLECEERFTTFEKVEEMPLVVIKRDGRRQVFEPTKILKGLIRAGEKRAIPVQIFEDLVSKLEVDLRTEFNNEVTTDQIGDILLNKLRRIDEVAYVRFASVLRNFSSINSFKEELEIMIEKIEKENNN